VGGFVRKLICATLAVIAAAWSPAWANTTSSVATKATASVDADIDSVESLVDSGQFDDALRVLKPLVTDKAFDTLPAARRHVVLLSFAEAAFWTGDNAGALDAIRRACDLPSAAGRDWLLRFMISSRMEEGTNEGVTSLTVLAEEYPDMVAMLPRQSDRYVLRLMETAKHLPDGATREIRLLKALFRLHWTPKAFGPDSADYGWIRLAAANLAQGDLSDAKEVVAEISDPNVVVEILADKRFDAVVASDPAHYDITAVSMASLETARARKTANTDLLEPVDELAIALMRLGRYDEAFAVLDSALPKTKEGEKTSSFTDFAAALPWVKERRGEVLSILGRDDEATKERQDAAALPENGTSNASQALNLAGAMNRRGRPKDALALLEKVTAVSPYGRMVYEMTRACAYAQLGDKAKYAESMSYLKAHSSDGPMMPMDAAVCAKDLDGAASAEIALLLDPDTRLDILLELQEFVGPDPSESTSDDDSTWGKVQKRADVRAAIDKVGRVKRIPIWLVR
jgi:tetratricopeptide (TPR) repeat protein